MICNTCGAYYRLSPFHKDTEKCEECSYILPQSYEDIDDETAMDIHNLVHRSCKTQAMITDE